MGCDIHVYLELYNSDSGKYHLHNYPYNYKDYNNSPESRNYWLFGVLADVRSYHGGHCISKPRGVPGDASQAYRHIAESSRSDWHSHSYFHLDELLENEFINSKEFKEHADYFYNWLVSLKKYGLPPEHVRICFFFDN